MYIQGNIKYYYWEPLYVVKGWSMVIDWRFQLSLSNMI